jgi:hypothetical protein
MTDEHPNILDPDDENYTGCVEGCANPCWADHKGEE